MIEIIHQKFIETPQNKDINPFQFAVIDVHNEFNFYIEQTDILGTNYWIDSNLEFDDEIYFHFYLNLNSNEIPDQIWNWLKKPEYSPYLNGIQYEHTNRLIYDLQNGKDLIFPNQTLDSFKLLKEAIRDLMLDDIRYIKPDYQKILNQLEIKMKELQ